MPETPHARLQHPRHWPLWAGLGLMWCLARLPYAAQRTAGRVLGALLWRLARHRRHIAAVNLELCFPELDAPARRRLLRAHFASLGMGMVETAMCWWTPAARLRPLARVRGLEHLRAALAQGKGVLLLSGHFTTLELGGRLLALHAPFHVLYRTHKNPVFERVMRRARERHFERAIPRDDMRALLRSLKANMPVWYAPDQNYGREHSIFVPFFGIPAATVTATHRIARISGAPVVPFFQRRLPGGAGYEITLYPALEDFPSDDAEADTQRVNAVIEERIREAPEQYLWVHRRFKTRPPGAAYPYGDGKR